MKWKNPPVIKIYEALGSLADGRIEIDGNTAKVYSSSRNKFYVVNYDEGAIMANDNGSYWQGYLGYPAIAYLLKAGVLPYKSEFRELLKGIAWKDINQKFKNDFDKTIDYIFSKLDPEKVAELKAYAEDLSKSIEKLNLNLLGEKAKPPQGY